MQYSSEQNDIYVNKGFVNKLILTSLNHARKGNNKNMSIRYLETVDQKTCISKHTVLERTSTI